MNEIIKHKNTRFNFNSILSFGEHDKMNLINIGTRYKLMLVIYGVGFYDSSYIYNPDTIYSSGTTKGLVLQYYRGVSFNTFINIMELSIKNRNINNNVEITKYIEYLKSLFINIKKIDYKDIIHLIWDKEELYIYYNNNLLGGIESNEFAEIVFKCYLDDNSAINNLKENIYNKNL
jgi:hypothetical protein